MSVSPTDAELIRRALESRLAEVFTALPGHVVSYDEATKTADVRVALRRVIEDEDGEPSEEELPVLRRVPVLFPRSAKFRLHFRLEPDDGVLLVFSKWATGEWRANGDVATPGDRREHSHASPVAVPGWFPDARAMTATGEQMGNPDGPALHFGEETIDVGDGANFVALANKVKARLDALAQVFQTWVPVPNDGGAALKSAIGSWASGSNDVASENLKAD